MVLRASKEMTHPVVTCKLGHWKLRQTAVEYVEKAATSFFTEYFIPHTLESLENSAIGFVEKKMIILAAVVLLPVCGRGISGGHDGRAQTSARGKKTE